MSKLDEFAGSTLRDALDASSRNRRHQLNFRSVAQFIKITNREQSHSIKRCRKK